MRQVKTISAWREANNVSVKEFAERAGVQDSAVCKWERGRVSAIKALTVHQITGIPLHELRPDIYPKPQPNLPEVA